MKRGLVLLLAFCLWGCDSGNEEQYQLQKYAYQAGANLKTCLAEVGAKPADTANQVLTNSTAREDCYATRNRAVQYAKSKGLADAEIYAIKGEKETP